MSLDLHFEATLGTFHVDVGFRSGSGETTVLLGESGSGKTTVLRYLAGLLRAQNGYMVLDDELYVDTSAGVNVPAQQRPVGYVFQDYVLFPHLTVYDNVAFGLRMQGVDEKVIRQRVGEVMDQAHLLGYDDRHPKELSGGQQQRVAIARALALRPQLLMLDESLSALDIQTRHEVERELHEILGTLGVTTVMVSHQYSDALNFGHQIIVLERGAVIQQGVHADLLRYPHSAYVAEMVGVNRLVGKVSALSGAGCRVELGPATEVVAVPAAELKLGATATVIVHPRSLVLSAEAPDDSVSNIFRCRVTQVLPVSARLSSHGGAVEGLMEIGLDLGPGLPFMRAEVDMSDPSELGLGTGASIYVFFAPRDALAYA